MVMEQYWWNRNWMLGLLVFYVCIIYLSTASVVHMRMLTICHWQYSWKCHKERKTITMKSFFFYWFTIYSPLSESICVCINDLIYIALQNLRKLQNFNSLMGVVGSLSHSALARLTKTMECVPVDERKVLKELTALVSSSSNFSAYRKALTESKGFKIPIL